MLYNRKYDERRQEHRRLTPEVVQDLLVLEFRAIKVSVDALHTEMGTLRTEMQLRTEKLEQVVETSNARLEQMILSSDEKHTQAIRTLSEKLDFAIDIRERLASLEGRLPRQ